MNKNEIIEIFIKEAHSKERRYSDCTTSTYLGFISKYIDSLNDKDISDTKEQDVRRFMSNYESMSDGTYNLCLSAIKTLYDVLMTTYLVEEGYIKYDPTKRINKIAHPQSKERFSISDSDFDKMLHACKNYRDVAILTFFRYTGVRANELMNIEYDDFINYNSDNGLKLTITKGSKERVIYLNDKVIDAVNKYLTIRKNDCEYLFVSNGCKQMGESSLWRTVQCIAKRANLDDNVIDNLTLHSFRHTFATSLIDKGVNIAVVSGALGHASISTTNIYIDKSKLDIKSAMCVA